MNDGDIWILIPLFALMIPIVAILASTVFKPWLAMKQRQLELTSAAAAEKAAQYAAHAERLESRVRVLERIALDRGADLAGEIEALRDESAGASRLPTGGVH